MLRDSNENQQPPSSDPIEGPSASESLHSDVQPQLLFLSFCLSLFVCLIGFGGFLGWFAPGERFAWWNATIRPLRADTSLALVLSGVALLAIHRELVRTALVTTSIAFILSLGRLCEFLFHINTGLDSAVGLLSHSPGTGDLRMSPTSALSLTLVGVALYSLLPKARHSIGVKLASSVGVIVALLGCISLLGNLSSAAAHTGWSQLTRMSVQGGFANVLLGTSLLLYAWAQRSPVPPKTSQLLRNMILYSVLGVFFVAVFSAAFGMLPLYERLQRIERERLLETTENRALTLEKVLERIRSTALQVANRTRARGLLEKLASGESTLEQFKQDSNPIFQDIEKIEPDIRAICRTVGPSSDCVLSFGRAISPAEWPEQALTRNDMAMRGPIIHDNEVTLVVSTPIWSSDSRRLGTDILLFSASDVISLVRTGVGRRAPHVYLGQRVDGTERLFSATESGTLSTESVESGSILRGILHRALQDEYGIVMMDSEGAGSLVAFTPVRNTPWAVIAVVDSEQFDFAANNMLRRVSLGVLGLIGIGCLIIYSLIRTVAYHALSLQRALRQRTESLERELVLRQNAERSLSEQQRFLHQVIDLNPNLIFAKNRKGEFTLVNTAVAEAYGISIQEILGKTDADFNSNPDEVEHFREDDRKVLDGRQELIIPEEVLTDAKGRRRWLQTIKRPLLDETGQAYQILGVATDITIRKEAEETKSRLAAIVESSTDAIIGTTLDKIVTSWNNAAEGLYGYSAAEAVGKPIDFLVPEDRIGEISDILTRLVRGERIEHYETVRLRRDGQLVHVSLSVSLVVDSRGRVVGISSISRDISRRKEIEHELARYREELEEMVAERTRELVTSQDKLRQSERMASIGALASGIAHEINNPVGAILLAAQNGLEIADQPADPARTISLLKDACQRIIHNAKRCGGIVKGVLQFSREQRRERTATDLNASIRNSIELIRESMDVSQSTIRLDLSPTLPAVIADPLEMEQVIVNLVKNAIESASGRAEIDIRTEVVGNMVRIRISDNGCGIPREQLKHIFDPFFTTRQRQGGTGLGLSVVHGIVSNQGGTITVESEVGDGTVITIDYPCRELDGEKTKYARDTHC
ncbi:MAG: PAS domain S-box protein [Bdellovibrionota bacterium]